MSYTATRHTSSSAFTSQSANQVNSLGAATEFDLDTFEVAEAFEVPLGFFLEPANRQIHSRHYEGKQRQFYAYPFGDYYIWGATAGMLSNLSEVLREVDLQEL